MDEEILVGRNNIADFLGYDDFRTVQRSIIPLGAPIAKIGGMWMANKRELLDWLKTKIREESKKMQ